MDKVLFSVAEERTRHISYEKCLRGGRLDLSAFFSACLAFCCIENLSNKLGLSDVVTFFSLTAEASNLRPRLAANVEKARSALTKLQETFQENPALQTGLAMKQMLDVLKDGK